MKIAKIFSVLLAGVLAFASCDLQIEEPQIYTPGESEDPACFGVYFPTQEATGSHIVDPTAAKEVTFTVARKKSDGAIEVPFKLTSDSDVFVPGKISFEDGQSETTLTVSYDKAQTGHKYAFQIAITDSKYAALYSDQVAGLSFDVLLVSWSYIGVKDGEAVIVDDESQAAKFNWTQTWWGEEHSGIVKFYEVDGLRHCVTVTDGGAGFWGPDGSGEEIEFLWRVKDDYVFFEPIFVFHHSTYDADVCMYDEYGKWNFISSNAGQWADALDYYTQYPEELPLYCSYYENGAFYFKVAYYYMLGVGGWNQNNAIDVYGLAEGVTRVDYSLEMETEYSYDGVLPLYFEVGADVASVKVAGAQGELSAKDVAAFEAGIADGSVESIELDLEELELGLEFAESGIYTVAAVAFDEAGEVVNDAVLSAFYVTADPEEQEKYQVQAIVGLEAVPERYEMDEYTTAAFYVQGHDVTECHLALFQTSMKALTPEQIASVIYDPDGKYALNAAAIEQINAKGGLYDYFTGLKDGAIYTLVVWVANGALDTVLGAEYTTPKIPYVWNLIGKGTLNEPFTTMFGEDPLVIPVDVYQEKNNPGIYMYKGTGLALANWFYEQDMTKYKGQYWDDEGIIFDATDPTKVVIDNQSYGFYAGSSYGWPVISTVASGQTAGYGKLVNGHLTLTAREYLVGMGTSYYYGPAGYDLALPTVADMADVTPVNYVEKSSREERVMTVVPMQKEIKKISIERDIHVVPAKVVKVAPRAKSDRNSKPSELKIMSR